MYSRVVVGLISLAPVSLVILGLSLYCGGGDGSPTTQHLTTHFTTAAIHRHSMSEPVKGTVLV